MADFSVPDILVQAPEAPADPPDPMEGERDAVRRYGRILSASSAASRALAELDGRFAEDLDFPTAPQRYREALDGIGREHEDAFEGDAVGRGIFRRDFGTLAENAIQRFQSANVGREAAHWARTLEDRWDSLAGLARGMDEAGRAAILRQAALEAHRAQGFGLVPDADAAFRDFLTRIEPAPEAPASETMAEPGRGPWGSRTTNYRRDRDGEPAFRTAEHRVSDEPGERMRLLSEQEDGDGAEDVSNGRAGAVISSASNILSAGNDAQVAQMGSKPGAGGEAAESRYHDPAHAALRKPVVSDPPAGKKDLAGVRDHWMRFNDAVARLPDVTDTERHVYSRIFAAEGGMDVDKAGGAVAGVTPDTLKYLKTRDKSLSSLPDDPRKLNHDQAALFYRGYSDYVLRNAGGVSALDQIGDWNTAAAVADTVYRDGASGGGKLVGEAIRKTIDKIDPNEAKRLGVDDYAAGDTVGSESLAAIKTLERAGHGDIFRGILADIRTEKRPNEKARMNRFR